MPRPNHRMTKGSRRAGKTEARFPMAETGGGFPAHPAPDRRRRRVQRLRRVLLSEHLYAGERPVPAHPGGAVGGQ